MPSTSMSRTRRNLAVAAKPGFLYDVALWTFGPMPTEKALPLQPYPDTGASSRRSATNSLERALQLLETIERAPNGLSNSEISRLLGIPKSTCSYIVSRLERRGYLTRDEDSGRYRIGLEPVALARRALSGLGIRSVGEVALYKLAEDTGLCANIGILDRGRVLLVDRVESPPFIQGLVSTSVSSRVNQETVRIRDRNERDIGRELPCDRSAIGNVLLAYLPNAAILSLIDRYSLDLTNMAQLKSVRNLGYACTYGQYEEGLCAIAAPIIETEGTVQAAVSVNGYNWEANWNDQRLISLVKAAGRDIARRAH